MSLKRKKILIIGSGISGLAAAQKLHENGFEVEILEARADHGGRIRKNESFTGYPIEIGGEEIHKVYSPYHLLAKRVGADLKPDHELNHFFEDIESEQLLERQVFLDKYPNAYFYNEVVHGREKQDDNQSLLSFFQSKGLAEPFITWYENFWGVENGGQLRDISVKSFGEYESGRKSDRDLNLIVTNMSHFDILEKAFASVLPFVKYSTPVTEIHYGRQEQKVFLIDKNGDKHEGDYIIVTVPITQLQNESIRFFPELSASKQDAIQRMKVGKGGKIHLLFKKRFWPDKIRNVFFRSKISFLWNIYQKSNGSEDLQTNLFVGLVAGDLMDQMQNPETRQILVDELLEKMGRLFNYPDIKQELVDVLWSDFTQIDYIQGNYTMPCLNLGKSRAIYQEPIDHVLYFAGEAAHLTDAMTIHGAYETGLRDADRIIYHEIASQFENMNIQQKL